VACGGRVRIEDADLLSAQLPDGSTVRYTTSLARAQQDEQCELLVAGGGALAQMLAAATAQARVVGLALTAVEDAEHRARQAFARPAPRCGRCTMHHSIPGGAAPPLCEACPLRDGRYVFAGLEEVRGTRQLRRWTGWGVELIFQMEARDRQGRVDDTLRLA